MCSIICETSWFLCPRVKSDTFQIQKRKDEEGVEEGSQDDRRKFEIFYTPLFEVFFLPPLFFHSNNRLQNICVTLVNRISSPSSPPLHTSCFRGSFGVIFVFLLRYCEVVSLSLLLPLVMVYREESFLSTSFL